MDFPLEDMDFQNSLLTSYLFCDVISYIDEAMNGQSLKDLFDCGIQGLDMGMLGLNRFKEQLSFKKCLLDLFKKEDEFVTPKKKLLSPIQTRNLLTR